ncbi:unnamed protein product [Durusdinium trenchii]|uniref:Succinate dehydrogenase assembly factor 3 n=1 Tax=Durusdinium trenchii TaxID=1381693 RepID=A0ABP0NLQ3_9DINO
MASTGASRLNAVCDLFVPTYRGPFFGAACSAGAMSLVGESKSLFRTIMRLHRVKLDPAMRSLGDTYARKEFRLHAKPQVQEAHKQMFLKEWRAYVALCFLQKAVNIPQKLLIVGAAIAWAPDCLTLEDCVSK